MKRGKIELNIGMKLKVFLLALKIISYGYMLKTQKIIIIEFKMK